MNPLTRHAFLFALLIAFAVVAISPQRNGSAHSIPSLEPVGESAKDNPKDGTVAGFDFSNLDRTASDCQDFNKYKERDVSLLKELGFLAEPFL